MKIGRKINNQKNLKLLPPRSMKWVKGGQGITIMFNFILNKIPLAVFLLKLWVYTSLIKNTKAESTRKK